MNVRDATSEDAGALAAIADDDVDGARLIRDRSVRVAEVDDDVVGFVAFDAGRGAVHVTRLAGDPEAVPALLGEPCSFAAGENLPVEMVLPASDADLGEELGEAGFEDAGAGPRFDGQETRRYRWQPRAE